MAEEVRLLSASDSCAVVQLPERAYPGVVVQGDTLHSLVQSVAVMQDLLNTGGLAALSVEIHALKEELSDMKAAYERVLADHEMGLPYFK